MDILKLVRLVFDWRVILDILLIAAALFLLYRTLQRLGAWKIVAGIFLAIAIFVVANILDLRGIRWLYSNLSQVALIGLIVIFQPEIRKVFERAASFRGRGRGKDYTGLLNVIVDTAFSLAQQRRGAIFVVPGKEPVERWLSGGVDLNATPTFPLIMSIFDPNSPGHDGALIIDGGRLTQFGVRLPLSKTGKLSDEFGTRHHAAMGLSEVSDSLVVVVSEERGAITTFHGGKAHRVNDRNDLATRLIDHWETIAFHGIEVPRGIQTRELVSQISLSLVVALVFWSTVILGQMEIREKAFNVPVEYIGIPKHLALAGDKPTEIKLHLTGPKSRLDAITPASLSTKINLSKALAGRQVFVVSRDNVLLPRSVKLVGASPPNIAVSLEEIVETEVAVQPQLVGTLPKGLELVSVTIKPKELKVLAPAGEMQHKIYLMTSPVYLESIKEDTKLLKKIVAPPNVQPADKEWPDVEVLITVKPRP
ncbi:MAG: diadenylate cyclase [Deltaproteobacteria bacterium]|nr:MAG: diadenylate cyclase [Deltaproteobacteria bacterium]